MMEHPFNDLGCYDRLLTEYHKYHKLIIAYDFDNTIFDFHNDGGNYTEVIELLKLATKLGNTMMLFSAERDAEKLKWKVQYAKELGIGVDFINESPILPGSPKPYYNILLDDRAGLESAYNVLNNVIKKILTES